VVPPHHHEEESLDDEVNPDTISGKEERDGSDAVPFLFRGGRKRTACLNACSGDARDGNDELLIGENAFISFSSFQSFESPEQAFRQASRFLPGLVENRFPFPRSMYVFEPNSGSDAVLSPFSAGQADAEPVPVPSRVMMTVPNEMEARTSQTRNPTPGMSRIRLMTSTPRTTLIMPVRDEALGSSCPAHRAAPAEPKI
jgi:hypothetical protein